jgi:hypothetical protein
MLLSDIRDIFIGRSEGDRISSTGLVSELGRLLPTALADRLLEGVLGSGGLDSSPSPANAGGGRAPRALRALLSGAGTDFKQKPREMRNET